MDVKNRILLLNLLEKQKKNPQFFKDAGIEVSINKIHEEEFIKRVGIKKNNHIKNKGKS